MKLSLAASVLVALVNAAALPGATRDITRIPAPEGYFESHLGSVGFTVTPAEPQSLKLAARAITHFYACVDDDFRGKCESFTVNTGECCTFLNQPFLIPGDYDILNLPADLYDSDSFNNDWNDAITSIGPDKGTTCTIWL
jgi:hypothetical protein